MRLRAYQCGVRGMDWSRTVHAETAGKAKSEYFRDIRESWPEMPFTAVTAHCIGGPITDSRFLETAKYRGVAFARVGMAVEVDGSRGVIVGHNSSANFDVLFESGAFAGCTLNCHPNWRIRYFQPDGALIQEFQERK